MQVWNYSLALKLNIHVKDKLNGLNMQLIYKGEMSQLILTKTNFQKWFILKLVLAWVLVAHFVLRKKYITLKNLGTHIKFCSIKIDL